MYKKQIYKGHYLVRAISYNYLEPVLLILMMLINEGINFNVAPNATYIASIPEREMKTKSSYFGYSVGILRTKRDIWLLSGAPRANSSSSPSVFEPGALFKCPIKRPLDPCEEVILDITRNFEPEGNSRIPYRNNSWLGASFDIDADGNVIVCAPRWKNAFYDDEYRISGLCYNIGADLSDYSAHILAPLVNEDQQIYNYYGSGVYNYAHGLCGMDVHITSDKKLLLGSPGVLNWQGSIVRYLRQPKIPTGGISKRSPSITYSQYLVPNPIKTSQIRDSNFLGYSVTSGIFDEENGLYYVAGAPRGAGSHGLVLIFLMRRSFNQPLFIKETRQGTQLGEYFGESVAAPDLNGDGLSDLVIGAPMNSRDGIYDTGCVYVFLNNKRTIYELEDEGTKIFGDLEEGARFGTALGTPGDLDMDGYEDLLVGSPYEKENSGAVYVFSGSRNGIVTKYSQKLLGQDVAHPLSVKGFGISFSKALDIDKNLYPDFAIGSFLSDNAVVMSTRPVIQASGEITSEPSKLTLTQENFMARACIYYEGIGVPDRIEINARLQLSQKSSSGEISVIFSDTGSTEKEIAYEAAKNVNICKTHRVNVKLSRSNAQNPVLIRMTYWLKEDIQKGPEQPIMAPYSERPPNLVLSFITGCKYEICSSDLETFAHFKGFQAGDYFLIGGLAKITMEVSVTNKNDPAFLPNITLSLPNSIIVLPTLHDCTIRQETNHTSLGCQLKNPLKKFEKDVLSFDLDITGLDDRSPDIEIPVAADSASDFELNKSDNVYTAKLRVRKESSVKVTGWSQPEQITYERISKNQIKSNESISVEHVFSIEKSGVTSLKEVFIEVKIPTKIQDNFGNEVTFVQLIGNEVTFNSKSQVCQVTEFSSMLPEAVSLSQITYKPIINCSTPNVKCSKIKCLIGQWRKPSGVASLSVTFKLNISGLSKFIKVEEGFSVYTDVNIGISPHEFVNSIEGLREDSTTVQTLFHPGSLPAEQLAWWVYLAAALGGLLVLFVIAFILYKFGFFRRKKKEELQAQQATLITDDEMK